MGTVSVHDSCDALELMAVHETVTDRNAVAVLPRWLRQCGRDWDGFSLRLALLVFTL